MIRTEYRVTGLLLERSFFKYFISPNIVTLSSVNFSNYSFVHLWQSYSQQSVVVHRIRRNPQQLTIYLWYFVKLCTSPIWLNKREIEETLDCKQRDEDRKNIFYCISKLPHSSRDNIYSPHDFFRYIFTFLIKFTHNLLG